jgi:general secretion pathway protein A
MYQTYYNFTSMPFQLTPDCRFFFGSSGHGRAIAHLVYGLAQEEGFIVITGEVGAGKTTLVERLWSELDHQTYLMARVVTTQVSGDDLLRLVVTGFGLDDTGADKATLLRRLEGLFRDERALGRRCLLVVDEAQNLSIPALEELRMLSNIAISGRAPLQTILLGQPQFRCILGSSDLDQLRQRVLAGFHLGPLTENEVRPYIEHRLRTVGWTGNPSWTDDALATIFRHTGGVPRKINTLCSRLLLYGALEQSSVINTAMVETTAEELKHDLGSESNGTVVPTAHHADATPNLLDRLEALENGLGRQDRILRQLMELLGGYAEARK